MPPHEGVAADEAPCHVTDGCPSKFDFKRLGGRAPAFLMSPWIPAGTVFQEPKGKSVTAQFDLSSIPATAKELFNLTALLTKRDEWAGGQVSILLYKLPDPALLRCHQQISMFPLTAFFVGNSFGALREIICALLSYGVAQHMHAACTWRSVTSCGASSQIRQPRLTASTNGFLQRPQ